MDYSNIKVPTRFVNEIRKFIEENAELGYRSPSEFIIEAARQKLQELKKMILLDKKTKL